MKKQKKKNCDTVIMFIVGLFAGAFISSIAIYICLKDKSPSIHYHQKVKVVKGFYSGCVGEAYDNSYGKIRVWLDNCNGEEVTFSEHFKKSYLKPIEATKACSK